MKNSSMTTTSALWQKDRAHFLHPWTHFDTFKRDGSLVIQKARGAYVWDASGKRYLDGIGGLWCVNIGYGREEMAQAIADQVRTLSYSNCFTDCTNEPATELAAKLADLAPGSLNHVAYSVSGSCANDTAIRLAHAWMRDVGPNFVVNDQTGEVRRVDWIFRSWGGLYSPNDADDQIARKVLDMEGPDRYRAPMVAEGGALQCDGAGITPESPK